MNILIIQILRMGDGLQLIPVIKGIKQYFPGSNLCVLTSGLEAKLLEGSEEIDSIYTLSKEAVSGLILTGNKANILKAVDLIQSEIGPLADIQWDWAVNFSHTFSSALLSFLFNAAHCSGFYGTKDRRYIAREKWVEYSLASFVNRKYSSFNWVDINKNVAGIDSVPGPPYIKPKLRELLRAARQLDDAGFEYGNIIGLQPGASGFQKMWPVEKFGRLGESLVKNHGYNILIFGSKEEQELGAVLESRIGTGVLNLTGKTSISELNSFLSFCELLVTNDTGTMHLSSAVGTPAVALFFSTHFVETGPYGEGHAVIHPDIPCFPCQGPAKCSHKDCLKYISPELVENVILSRSGRGNRLDDLLTGPGENVKTYFSGFDCWGFLDWMPLCKKPVTLLDIERLALKLTLVSHSGAGNNLSYMEKPYMKEYLSNFAYPAEDKEMLPSLDNLVHKLSRFKGLLRDASLASSDIQAKLLVRNPDKNTITKTGENLSLIEEKLSGFDKDSCISFLSELFEIFRENIDETDYLTLSTKTLDALRNVMTITDGMLTRLENIKEEITCYT